MGEVKKSQVWDADGWTCMYVTQTSTASTADGEPKRVSVDYSNVEQLSSVLRAHGVSVVVAALLLADDASTQSQINLIRAAALSGTVKKFIPTEYHLDYNVPITYGPPSQNPVSIPFPWWMGERISRWLTT